MSQSLSRVLIHVIFSTKNRFPFLADKNLQTRMHAYLARILDFYDSPAIVIDGVQDHVHILCLLSRKHSTSEIIKILKANSSHWAKTLGGKCGKFSWQSGYGIFSIHQSQIEPMRRYIQNQTEHHRKKTFQEEFLEILHEYQMPYDERYIWD
jgi:putative transposase